MYCRNVFTFFKVNRTYNWKTTIDIKDIKGLKLTLTTFEVGSYI